MDLLEKKAELDAKRAELDAKVAEMEAELDQIKEEAEQAEEINRAKKSAQRYLEKDLGQVTNKNYWINKRFSETDNANVKVNEETITLQRNATSWKIEDSKVLATYTEKVTKLSLVYVNPVTLNEYEISVSEDGKMELPYMVADTYRSYTRIKTVVRKIADYIESQNVKARLRNSQEEANTKAVAHLTKLYPDSTVQYEKGWRRKFGRRGDGFDVHTVIVSHPNGNSVTMNVGYSSSEVFTLSYPKVRFNKELSVLNILDIAQSA